MRNWILFPVALMGLSLVITATLAEDTSSRPKSRWHASKIGYQPVLLVELGVSDLDRAVKFYRDTLDFDLAWRSEELQWAELRSGIPGVSIGLGKSEKAKGSGTASMNWAVNNVDAARALLEKRGVKFLGPTLTIPGVVKLADFADPDGNRIRLAGAPGAGKKEE